MPGSPFDDRDILDVFADLEVEVPALGVGSFKAAYRGTKDGRSVVVKVLTEPMPEGLETLDTSDLPDRFARELSGMTNVSSPHVVALISPPAVLRIGPNPYLWYLEPFYPGGTLEDALKAGAAGGELGDLVLTSLLQAVRDMWTQASIVHRDIKPGNIVFDGDGLPVLLDLGIAYHAQLSAITDSLAASPRTGRYAAPEQFEMRRMAKIDFRTDLFQVGLVAYESYTGRHPYWRPLIDAVEYMDRLASGEIDVEPLLDAGCSPERVSVVERLLAGRPSGRYRRVEAPLRAIEEASR